MLTGHEIVAKTFQGLIGELFPYPLPMKEFFLISLRWTTRETIKKQNSITTIVSSYKRYSIDEITRKVYSELSENSSGLSGAELATRTKINRMTLAKYLDLMLARGLVRKKKLVV
jgi:hypothetical protein